MPASPTLLRAFSVVSALSALSLTSKSHKDVGLAVKAKTIATLYKIVMLSICSIVRQTNIRSRINRGSG
jgi:hypothetical protein